jgi:hypothetical protein
MIRSDHVREEIAAAGKVIDDANADVSAKLKALYKLTIVAIKVVLGNRLNLVRVMEKLGVEKVKPTRTEDNETKTEKTE